MTTTACTKFTTPPLDDPRYYADMCHACGHFKNDHPEFVTSCQNCGQAPGILNWGGTNDSVSLARNPRLIQRWCRRCVLVAQIAHMRPIVAKLPDLERELAALDGAHQPRDPSCEAELPVEGESRT